MIRFSAITPHPTVIIPSIGKSNLNLVRKTANAMKQIGEKFRAVKADTIVLISPHGPVQYDKFMINYSPTPRGDLGSFGDQRRFVFENNRELVDEIMKLARESRLPVGLVRELELDRGALVPLHYLVSEKDTAYNPKLVHMSFSMLPLEYHFNFGRVLGKVLQESPKVISLIASSDLSHRVSPGSPAGYSPQGRIFDKKLVDFLKRKNIKGILEIEPELIEEAGECGLRSIVMMLGAISNLRWDIRAMSYEAPLGVGYLAANINIK
ncbi:MAG: class III extradiol dioxygenase subunit B-like domain-containing protein [Candidatus Moranbacteria bacterium]|nr:class III extradiol dioxygenase subunit B-like domain-containing protein [Candidatus Moranbacteria bacterium]